MLLPSLPFKQVSFFAHSNTFTVMCIRKSLRFRFGLSVYPPCQVATFFPSALLLLAGLGMPSSLTLAGPFPSAPAASSGTGSGSPCALLRLMKKIKNTAAAIRANPATPPTTPPMMAALWSFLPAGFGAAVGVCEVDEAVFDGSVEDGDDVVEDVMTCTTGVNAWLA